MVRFLPASGLRRRGRVFSCLVLGSVLLTGLAGVPPAAAGDNAWVVDHAGDHSGSCTPGDCTLREAIDAANASTGSDLITFDIAPSGPHTITVGSSLPALTDDDITIDASTQPGVTGMPPIRLDDGAGAGTIGFEITGDRATIRGFRITRFDRYGIRIRSASGENVIAGNWIGTRDGTTDDGTGSDGIRLNKSRGFNVIGGTDAADRNIVSGGQNDGIQVEDSSDNVIIGNYIGMTADGRDRLPNDDSGIQIDGLSFRNRVGGTMPAERNVISGNDGIAVQLLGTMNSDGTCQAPKDNVVLGNYLGLNVDGQIPAPEGYGNTGEGAQMSVCASNNTIGGTSPGARNIISGNRADGVELDSSGGPGGTDAVCFNKIQGNYIGLDPSGTVVMRNVDDGIGLDNGVCATLIGGIEPGAGNFIGGNLNDGIDISRPGSDDNVIEGNVIGLMADGDTVARNGINGVHIRSKPLRTIVQNNVISANISSGIRIDGFLTEQTQVIGNKIGTDTGGTITRRNLEYGILVTNGAKDSLIQENLIRGNGLDGVAVERPEGSDFSTVRNTITRNRMLLNGGLGIDLLPTDGVNANDGGTDSTVGNLGLDFPVIEEATSSSVRGTARPNATVEVFKANADTGDHGEGETFLGSTVADGAGAWCLGGLSASGAVTTTATDANGNTSEFSRNLDVSGSTALCEDSPPQQEEPSASFTHSCTNLECSFTDTSTDDGTITAWDWDFGDGGTSDAQHPTHTYAAAGTYTVTLTVTDDEGLSDTTSADVTVSEEPPPSADTLFSDEFTEPDGSDPANWETKRSASDPAAGATVQDEELRFDVILTEEQVGFWQYVWARLEPFTPEWDTQTLTFRWLQSTDAGTDASSSFVLAPTIAGGNVLSTDDFLRFRVKDGAVTIIRRLGGTQATLGSAPITATSSLQSFELLIDGTTLSLSAGAQGSEQLLVSDLAHGIPWTTAHPYFHGSTKSATAFVALYDSFHILGEGSGDTTNDQPSASFTHSCTDLECSFTDTSTDDGTITAWDWDFGDGGTSDAQHPTHTYAAAGTYTVTLTVTDDEGLSDTTSADVTVSEPQQEEPSASFTHSCTDLECSFTDTSTDDGTITAWDWDFGDGGTSDAQHPTHTYEAPGTYAVSLTVTDDGGLSDTTSVDVTVEATQGSISLSATPEKIRGERRVTLDWTGSGGDQIDIFRDGVLLVTVADTGSYVDEIGKGGGETFTYQVCDAGTSNCSNVVSVKP